MRQEMLSETDIPYIVYIVAKNKIKSYKVGNVDSNIRIIIYNIQSEIHFLTILN